MDSEQKEVASLNEGNVLVRLSILEQQLKDLSEQHRTYMTIRENEMQFREFQNSVMRMERDISSIDTRLEESQKDGKRIEDKHLEEKEEQRKYVSSLQLRALWYFVTILVTILLSVLAVYIGRTI